MHDYHDIIAHLEVEPLLSVFLYWMDTDVDGVYAVAAACGEGLPAVWGSRAACNQQEYGVGGGVLSWLPARGNGPRDRYRAGA